MEFPAPAGMIPPASRLRWISKRVPRACGDDPSPSDLANFQRLSSPRLRG